MDTQETAASDPCRQTAVIHLNGPAAELGTLRMRGVVELCSVYGLDAGGLGGLGGIEPGLLLATG
jgi:hypothetical protein